MKGSVASIETFGLVDGPGIRTVVFLNGCHLRCKYCHNPEMWNTGDLNYTSDEIVEKVLRSKPYFNNGGGVTFSGGEPLLQKEFLIDVCKKLKQHDIHVALDTAGIGDGDYEEILSYVDLVLLDIKHITRDGYRDITCKDYLDRFFLFVDVVNQMNKEVWIRQVIVPGVHDNSSYIKDLSSFIKKHISNVRRVDFLPYHKLGSEKYEKLGLYYPYKDLPEMDKTRNDQLFEMFQKDFF